MNPLLNGFLRIIGVAPIIGPMPLSENSYRSLFSSTPSFVDYFPVVGFDNDTKNFLLDDNLNVGMAWEIGVKDLDSSSSQILEMFNETLSIVLKDLPQEGEFPYVVQIFLQNAETENLGELMESHLPNHLKDDPFSLDVIGQMKSHSDALTHEKGLFKDSRISQEKGWRISTQKIYLVIYRKASEAYWKKNKRKTPAQKMIDDTKSFITGLGGAGLSITPVSDYELIKWLAPYFSKEVFDCHTYTTDQHKDKSTVASYDIGQSCFSISPQYHKTKDEFERGIFQFGQNHYIRYLSTNGLENVPADGALTIGQNGNASAWEQFPPGSMITWTIIPEPKSVIDSKIDRITTSAQQSYSAEAEYTKEQGQSAKNEILRNGQRVFYTQVGAFLSASSIDSLLTKTTIAMDVMNSTRCLSFIKPEHDLISQDSFIKALPFVYDFEHDRKAALRARMTYLSHLAATLPFFGSGKGGKKPCYIGYKRSGEPYYFNPYDKEDRVRVAHQLVFGPTGAGKSATMIYLAIMSMAMNAPRQFILDKGNSFGLLADYYESLGKKVRRYTFNSNSKDSFPPFFETKKALEESKNSSNDQTIEGSNDDEARSYLGEMLNSLKIMVTGGKEKLAEELKQSDLNFLQNALMKGLQISIDNQSKHATISDVHQAMLSLSKEESIEALALRFREMADGLELWTKGPRGKLFNQIGEGFDEQADLTIIEVGSLANEGNEDMFAVAGLATLTNITALGERTQYDGRHIECIMDEGHYWMKLKLLVLGMIQATKVWRKHGIWLTFATQDMSDFVDEAKKILTQSENWWLLSMNNDEAKQVKDFNELSDEKYHLMCEAKIEKPNYTEATILNEKLGDGICRLIPPSLALALAQTDADEKAARQKIMREENCSELKAAMIIAEQIDSSRRSWQNR